MKSVKEISVESKILKRLQNNPNCLKLEMSVGHTCPTTTFYPLNCL